MTGSNTAAKQPPTGKPFRKGDPRINRKGRPRNSDQLKALGLDLLHEPARDKNGQPVIVDGHVATNLEMILRRMMSNPRQSSELIDRVFGKIPQPFVGADGGAIVHEVRVRIADDLHGHNAAEANADASDDPE